MLFGVTGLLGSVGVLTADAAAHGVTGASQVLVASGAAAESTSVEGMPHHVMSNCFCPSSGRRCAGWGARYRIVVCGLSAGFGTSCDTLGSWSRFPRPLYLRPTSLNPPPM